MNINSQSSIPLKRDYSILNNDFFEESKVLQARKEFSQTRVFRVFVILSTVLALTEPILVGFPASGYPYTLQIIFLALSSATFILDIVMTAVYYDQSRDKLSPWEITVAILKDEVLLDAFCLIFGWCTIFSFPGLAALRCLRVFRLLWYFELFPDIKDSNFNPARAFFSFRKASQLCLLYMAGIGQEIFTQKSKGGVVVIAIYLYVTYLVGVLFWVETGDLISINEGVAECYELNTCFFTMIRLSFYDGNGFDFVQTLIQENLGGYAFIAFLYMIIAAIIILNGLIGIFGSAFVSAIEDGGVEKSSANEVGDESSVTGGGIHPFKAHEDIAGSLKSQAQSVASPNPTQPASKASFLGRGKRNKIVSPEYRMVDTAMPTSYAPSQRPFPSEVPPAPSSAPTERDELIALVKLMREDILQLNHKVAELANQVRRSEVPAEGQLSIENPL